MNKVIKIYKKIISLNRKDRCILAEAFILFRLYELIIIMVPFRVYKNLMGAYNAESPENIKFVNFDIINNITWAVNAVDRFALRKSKCLTKALTAQKMLRKRSIDSTIYLGVKKDKFNKDKVEAHAWLRAGRFFITGGTNMNEFTKVAMFSTYCKDLPVGTTND